MTVQDIIDELNDHGFTDTSTTRKVALINDTVWDINSRQAWPYLETTIDLTFDGSSATPTNFPPDFRAALVIVRADTGEKIEWIRMDQLYRLHGEEISEVDQPQNFYFVGKQLRFWPIPPAGTVLHMPYLKKQATLTSSSVEADILIPKEHHRAIVLGALWKLNDMEDDYDIGQRFQAEYESRIQTMDEELFVSQYDRTDRIYDIDTDLFEYLL